MLVMHAIVKQHWKKVTSFIIANAVIFTLFIQAANFVHPNQRIVIVTTEDCIPIVRQPLPDEV